MGHIRCSKCGKQREKGDTCPHCKGSKCYISIYWHGEHKKIWRFHDGFLLDYDRANAMLGEIRTAITKRTFNPVDYAEGNIQERKFEHKLDLWLTQKEKELLKGSIRPSSYSNIEGHVKNYIRPFFEGWDVREIRFEQLEEFKDSLPDTIKRKTKANILVSLHAFFAWLFKKGVRDMLPFPTLEEDDDSKERVALEFDDQAQNLVKVPEGIERDMLELGMETGVRPGELVVLKVKDIDLRNARAKIQRTISKYTHVIESTKGRTKAFIPLSDRAMEILEKHVQGKWPEDYIFTSPKTGNRYSVKSPNRLWKKYTGLDVTYYESSRHSFASQLSDNGADITELKELMRHSDIRTTQRYIHKTVTKLRDVVNNRGNVIMLKREDARS